MKIKQFKDKALAHYSYAILLSEGKMAVVDPARNYSSTAWASSLEKFTIITAPLLTSHSH